MSFHSHLDHVRLFTICAVKSNIEWIGPSTERSIICIFRAYCLVSQLCDLVYIVVNCSLFYKVFEIFLIEHKNLSFMDYVLYCLFRL